MNIRYIEDPRTFSRKRIIGCRFEGYEGGAVFQGVIATVKQTKEWFGVHVVNSTRSHDTRTWKPNPDFSFGGATGYISLRENVDKNILELSVPYIGHAIIHLRKARAVQKT